MNNIFCDGLDDFILVYLDNILIYGNIESEHAQYFTTIILFLYEYKIYAKKNKSQKRIHRTFT